MITLSETARAQVEEYFRGKEISPVRVFLANGCGGQRLALALDDTKPGDAVSAFGKVILIMEQTLLNEAAPVSIDFGPGGFIIESSLKLASGSGCSGCGSSGSCGA